MLVRRLRSTPVFCDEHSACESCTVGVGARKASKMASELIQGRAPRRPQIDVIMMGLMGLVEDAAGTAGTRR